MLGIENTISCLDFEKILGMLSNEVLSEQNKENCFNIRPYKSFEKAVSEINKTEYLLKLILNYGNPNLVKLPLMLDILKRAEKGGSLSIKEILSLNKLFVNIYVLKEWYCNINISYRNPVIDILNSFSNYSEVTSVISKTFSDDESILDNATEELYKIRLSIKKYQNSAREAVEQIIKNPYNKQYLMDNIVTIKDDRFVIPVKSEYKNKIKGLVHQVSSSGNTVFIEPFSAVEKNNKLSVLLFEELQEINRILNNITMLINEIREDIKTNYNLFLEFDMILAKSKLAIFQNANKPLINNDKKINLINAKHPLINKNEVVPINIHLGIEFDTLIITGPNTGGKTASLKTLGIAILMGLSGMYILCDDKSEICYFSNIFVDIGDGQSIHQNLSTFSSHMINIIKITENADNQSLILLDELGSGTDPLEGAALAISIIEYLRKLRCLIMTTTHYSEIKKYALDTFGVENAGCYFDVENLKPTYQLIIGVPGSSNAFKISKNLGINQEILDYGQKIIEDENKSLEETIRNLEKSKVEIELAKKEISKIKKETETEKKRQEDIRISLEREYSKQRDINKNKSDVIIDRLIIESNKVFEELENYKKNLKNKNSNENVNILRKSVDEKIDKLSSKFKNKNKIKNSVDVNELKVGNEILLIDIQKNATLQSLPDKAGFVKISSGVINTRTHISNIVTLDKKQNEIKSEVKKDINKSNRRYASEIDVRGKTVDEALMEIDEIIDNNVIMNVKNMHIIHGKGTGALRKGIHQHLKSHKSVSNFRSGVYGEGEEGVTIIELK